MINNKTGKKFFSIFLILAMLLNMNLSVMAQTKLDSEILPVLTEEGQSDTLQTGVDNEDNSELTEQESSDEILPETDNENNFYEMELEPNLITRSCVGYFTNGNRKRRFHSYGVRTAN